MRGFIIKRTLTAHFYQLAAPRAQILLVHSAQLRSISSPQANRLTLYSLTLKTMK